MNGGLREGSKFQEGSGQTLLLICNGILLLPLMQSKLWKETS